MSLCLDPPSEIERAFTRKVVLESPAREDDRGHRDARELDIQLLGDNGSCIVSLGETKVLAQCSAHLCEPKPTRPNEGRLSIHFDVSPMAAPLQDSRTLEYRVGIGRLLDRVVRDSECVDLENLCLIAAESAWEVRVDVVLLNLAGNVAECASIATVAALAHFRRPDVTILGREMTIHPVTEHEPVPLHIYHYPFCLSFAFFEPREDHAFNHHHANSQQHQNADTANIDNGDIAAAAKAAASADALQTATILMDPTLQEENCCDGILTVGINSHEEVCALQQRGCLLTADQIELCIKLACARAAAITQTVKRSVEQALPKEGKSGSAKCAPGAQHQMKHE